MRNRLIITATILLTLLASVYAADPVVAVVPKLKLPAMFTDHMVLQREFPVPVWGWAEADEEVTVTIADQTVTTKTGADGKWKLTLKPLTAVDSIEMVVKGKDQTITIKDVAVGEVWLASGQSNMCIRLKEDPTYQETLTLNSATGLAKFPGAGDSGIRQFSVQTPASWDALDDVKGDWKLSTTNPKIMGEFIAKSYYFARELRKSTGVPIGIIVAAVGGTPASTWTSPDGLAAADFPGVQQHAEDYRKNRVIVKKWVSEELAQYQRDLAQAQKDKTPWPKYPVSPIPLPFDCNKPCMLFNGKIAPLQPFLIRGVIWSQGENNKGAKHYRSLMSALIADWRKGWGNPDLPFLFVQVPNTGSEIREVQAQLAVDIPHTGMAVINDTCTADSCNHPKYKEPAGYRLALLARALVYGEKIEYYGPVYDSMKIQANKAILSFTHCGTGLVAKTAVDPTAKTLSRAELGEGIPGTEKELKGFTIAGADNKFLPAKAEIQGDTVVVSNDQVNDPKVVRYLWTLWPALWTDTTLYNKEGIPASPFRTDVKKW